MANTAHSASAPTPPALLDHPAPPRRRLAPNVITLFGDDRAPVLNAPRRGRLPSGITRLHPEWESRLYVGAVCVVRDLPLNDDVPVRIIHDFADGTFGVEAIGPQQIVFGNGAVERRATVVSKCLVRTATVGVRYGH